MEKKEEPRRGLEPRIARRAPLLLLLLLELPELENWEMPLRTAPR